MTERVLVRDLMTVGVTTCSPDTPIVDISRLLLDTNVEALAVLNEDGHAIGVVGQDELVKAYTRDDCRDLTAKDIMSDGIPQVPPDIPLKTAAQVMQDQGVRALFLMHHAGGIEYPAAILTYRHFLRHLGAQNDNELSDLGIKAARQSPLEVFTKRRDAARRQTHLPKQE